ncbi:type I restriction enzyme, S subunit [Caminicella sporogenes DSM 14501]|uniref:Type I restriction enzyme, S subunit n=1 Tax=Caminicella sporogenes DSM 14501 TaxID=1121266 RepID=A0A1M6RHG7_9FIRM|nr:restriction endonuclease subunit S [Caminicella sporogenes]RKD25236.1 hypothetical protein BET04_03205 [Caminicella sporogenes]SHK31892.1 type I restriction enzyme, S subunit [Caminicella sporogenes DSM 14501]
MENGLKPYEEYKQTNIVWNEKTPLHWEVKRGKEIFKYKKEINSKYQCSNILSLTLKGVVKNSENNPIGLVPKDYATYQIFEKGDLVFKLIDLENYKTSRVGFVNQRGIMSPAYIRLQSYVGCNNKYFYYQYYDLYLRGVYNKLGEGVRSTLSGKDLLNLRIVVPPKEEQDQIVRYLDSKLSKINKFFRAKKKQVKLLKELKQAIINQAVTKGLDPNVKIKPSGIEWLGDIPEGWEVRRIKTIVKNTAITTTQKDEDDIYIGLENVESWSGRIINASTETVFDSTAKKYNDGNILFGKLRPYLAKVTIPSKKGVCSGEFLVLETLSGDLYNKFVEYLLRSNSIIELISMSTYGAKMPRAEWDFIGNIKIGLPSLNEQQEIVTYIEAKTRTIDKAIESIKKQIDIITEYRTSLISNVVTGKVDVRGIEVEDFIEESEEDFEDLEEPELLEENIEMGEEE